MDIHLRVSSRNQKLLSRRPPVALSELDVCGVSLLCYLRSLVLFVTAVDVLHALRTLAILQKENASVGLFCFEMIDEGGVEVVGRSVVGFGKGFSLSEVGFVWDGSEAGFALFLLSGLGGEVVVVAAEFSASLVVKSGEVGEEVVGCELSVGDASVVSGAQSLEVEHEFVGIESCGMGGEDGSCGCGEGVGREVVFSAPLLGGVVELEDDPVREVLSSDGGGVLFEGGDAAEMGVVALDGFRGGDILPVGGISEQEGFGCVGCCSGQINLLLWWRDLVRLVGQSRSDAARGSRQEAVDGLWVRHRRRGLWWVVTFGTSCAQQPASPSFCFFRPSIRWRCSSRRNGQGRWDSRALGRRLRLLGLLEVGNAGWLLSFVELQTFLFLFLLYYSYHSYHSC